MDSRHFDALGKLLSTSNSRRRLAALLVSLPAAGGLREILEPLDAEGKRHKKHKKKHKPPTPTPTPACTPDPAAKTCAGQCGTVTNNCQKVVDCGSCVCDVRCNDTPAACGAALQAVIDAAPAGATRIICPGTYQGGFTITRSLTLIGAGEGDAPARNTILDGANAQRVLEILRDTGTVTLQRLQIARGNVGPDFGGGISHAGTHLVMSDCTIAGNHGRTGAGMAHDNGALEMTRCTVRNNIAANQGGGAGSGGGLNLTSQATLTDCLIVDNETGASGGGLYVLTDQPVVLAGETVVQGNTAGQGGGIFADSSAITIGVNCRITGNTADSGQGGGIARFGGTVTLAGPDPSPIVVNNCHENCSGGVPGCQSGGSCPQ